MDKINASTIKQYVQKLRGRGESASVVERKLASVKKFMEWAHKRGILKDLHGLQKDSRGLKADLHRLLNFFKQLPRKSVPLSAKISPRENPLPISGNLSIQQYVGLVIILIFMAVMGAGVYNQFFVKNQASLAYPTALTRAGRILSFQGRLTDTLSNPITTATNVEFKLYSVSTGGTALYATGACSTTPDQDGIFSTLIGSDCGAEIASSVFSENTNVYLGVTVGADAEMTPRQQIANVGYAINAETLQGFPPGTNVSTIPYINSQGNLLIAASNPSINSTYASSTFTISSAQAATIQSAGTGDIILQATESGTLKFRTGGATDAFTRIFVGNTGLVGIGTTSPGQELDIVGDLQFSGALMPNSTAGTTGQFLISAGAGAAPTWTSTVGATSAPFSGITSGTNTTAAMVVGAGATLDYTSTGTINASSLIGGTWAIPGTIGSTTPNTGAFTTLSSTSGTNLATTTGNVGVGTTSPTSKLHVAGQCIAWNSIIPIRRKKKRKKGDEDEEEDYDYLEVMVKDVLPSDEVLSLNEETGQFEYQTVEKTLDMGVKEIYELITESGKRIETTGNHPYLVRQKQLSINQSHSGFAQNRQFTQQTGANFQNFLFSQDTRGITQGSLGINQSNTRILSGNIVNSISSLKKIQNIGDSHPCPFDAGFAESDRLLNDDTCRNRGFDNVIHSKNYYSNFSTGLSSSQWTKVIHLNIGDEIATLDGFEKIASIKISGRKQVYDLQIANTHNFVAGHYVDRKTGKALTAKQETAYIQYLTTKKSAEADSLTSYTSDEVAPDLSRKNLTQVSSLVNRYFEKGVDLGGVEPPQPDLTDQVPHRSKPTQLSLSHILGEEINEEDIVFGGIVAHNTYITGAATGQALAILNETGDQNILTASASGTTVANITRTGDLELKGAGDLRLYDADNSNYTGFQAPALASNLLMTLPSSAGTSGYALTTDGAGTTNWSDITTGGSIGPWTLSGSNLYPDSTSYNVAIGGTDAGTADLYVAGNVGIGTTSPVAQLQVHGAGGATNQIRVSNTTNSSAVDVTAQTTGGLINVRNTAGTSVINIDANPSTNSFFNTGGNVGIGTTGPLAKLHVEGSCVTGDTLLPIRRKKKRRKSQNISDGNGDDEENWEYEYLYERIDSVLPGDEVLSLNESTGHVEWHQIKNRMDMGVRDIYEIRTKSGRKIRTTGNHPYLTLLEDENVDYSPLTNLRNFSKITL